MPNTIGPKYEMRNPILDKSDIQYKWAEKNQSNIAPAFANDRE
jgi:hypothetical protein